MADRAKSLRSKIIVSQAALFNIDTLPCPDLDSVTAIFVNSAARATWSVWKVLSAYIQDRCALSRPPTFYMNAPDSDKYMPYSHVTEGIKPRFSFKSNSERLEQSTEFDFYCESLGGLLPRVLEEGLDITGKDPVIAQFCKVAREHKYELVFFSAPESKKLMAIALPTET